MQLRTIAFLTCLFLSPAALADARSEKPQAPVEVKLSARDLGGGRYLVTLRATPLADARDLALRLVLPAGVQLVAGAAETRPGAVRAGASQSLSATVSVSGPGALIGGGARVAYRSGVRSKADWIQLGQAPAPRARPLPRVVHLPSGLDVAEVRP